MNFRFFNVSLDVLKLVCTVSFESGLEIGPIITKLLLLPKCSLAQELQSGRPIYLFHSFSSLLVNFQLRDLLVVVCFAVCAFVEVRAFEISSSVCKCMKGSCFCRSFCRSSRRGIFLPYTTVSVLSNFPSFTVYLTRVCG